MKIILTILLIIGLIFLLTIPQGCLTEKKARVKHSVIVTAFPIIGAEYCAANFKPRDSLIKGNSVIKFDTVFVGGEVLIDTVRSLDTIRIIKTVQLPGKVITKTVVRVDTIRIESTAKLEVCKNQLGQMIGLLTAKTAESDKWKGKSRKHFWIMSGLGSLLLIIAGLKIRKMFKPKK